MAPPPAPSQRSSSPSQPSGKGEVSDLKMQLRQLAGSRAPGTDDSKRELFKKVISYMTVGIDVSSVFSEMVMCSATSDIVLKKMCYLYVGNYAKNNPDLALLTINFLQRDCNDEDPMIRGLALRSLCTLRVANLVEYLVGPLGSGLKDGSSYVRMVASIGVLKLYHISASTCVDADFPAMLKHLMLNDPDAQVVANCLSALQEIWSLEANTSEEASREREALLSKPVIYYLLNKIKAFSEWAQCIVLELVSKYVPPDSNEIFDIMNLLEDRLQHANGAVVLATIKLFLQLTLSMTDVHQQVYERIKAPLLTQASSGSPEQSFAVLSHLHLLVMRAPMLFSSDYKHFYCQYNEPFYVKKLKLEMLTAVANESNTYEIVTELCEYAANVDIPMARESIRAVGKIALQQYDVNAIVDRLLQFLEMEKDHVTAETLVLVKDLLRKYPQWSHDCIAVVGNISSKNVQEPKAKAALIWILGEYAQDMQDAPYVLESLVENWDDEYSAEVRLHLLTSVMKCFIRRPPETQHALGAVLAAGIADFHQDVHDRALFYYRLLQYNVSVAEQVVNPPKQAVSAFADTQSSEIKDRIFDEFNSLSVVYQKVLEWRLEKLLKENERNHDYYSELIYLCGKIQDVPIAMRVFTSMENHGIQPTSDVFNALVSVFLSSGNVMKALSLFETMGSSESYKPNADTYNAFILAYAMLGNDEKRQAWYSATTAAGFSVDLQTYQLLILEFIKLNKFCYADKFYKEMISAGIMPNVPILQGMLVCLCEARRLDNVSELLKFILDGGWEINVYMAEKLVWLYTELWRKEEMEELLLDLAKSNQTLEVQSRVHLGMIRMNAKVNCLDDVEYSVGRMLKQGMTFTCPDDVEKVICSYFRKEAYDRLDLFLECIKGTYKLTRSTYDLLAAGYRRVGLYEKLDRVVNDMKLA